MIAVQRTIKPALRGVWLGLCALGLGVVLLGLWIGYQVMLDSYLTTVRERALTRSTLFASSISSVLQTYNVASTLLAQDRNLIDLLQAPGLGDADAHLTALQTHTGARSLYLYTTDGTQIGATQHADIPINHGTAPYFEVALSAELSVFSTVAVSEFDQRFFFSRRIANEDTVIGVVIVEVDLGSIQADWSAGVDQVFVTNADDIILLSSRDEWRYRALTPFLEAGEQPGTMRAQFDLLPMLTISPSTVGPQVTIDNEAFLQVTRSLEFRGWTLTYLAPVREARARANALLASAVMVVALLAAGGIFIASRRVVRRSARIEQESFELRALNMRLTQEIEERLRVEQSLEAAERSLEQSSKLAALGQMSAAISHELNQPLAAMRTYLAGAQLLIQRNRYEEALASFARIDDLITRMNVITRQLKSFARKGSSELQPVDLRTVITDALSMMSPQIGQRRAEIQTDIPDRPVEVMGDNLRLEQILINLMRNALDAMKDHDRPRIDITLREGVRYARILVRDEGPGIEGDATAMFEPFFTTKEPGEGVGLGLAISASIAEDLGGRLMARNGAQGGAVFELSLPRLISKDSAA